MFWGISNESCDSLHNIHYVLEVNLHNIVYCHFQHSSQYMLENKYAQKQKGSRHL